MQGKGLITLVAVILGLICLNELLPTWYAGKIEKQATELAGNNPEKYQKEMASIKGEFAGTALENEWRDFSNKAAALTQGLKKENVWNILSRKAELENKFNQIKINKF